MRKYDDYLRSLDDNNNFGRINVNFLLKKKLFFNMLFFL